MSGVKGEGGVRYTVELPPELSRFYEQLAEGADLPVERVLADALYRLAGELSMRALREKKPDSPIQ